MSIATRKRAVKSSVNVSINSLILNLFNVAIPTEANLSFADVNEYAVKVGYLVHPDLCSDDIFNWLTTKDIDYNSTFYKKWHSVISKNRFELFIDQLMHYASTYGTDFTGKPYIPEEKADVPAFNTFKVILPVTKEEIISRCEKMLFSGIALKQETIENLLKILNHFNHDIDVEMVKNREAKMFLYKERGLVPKDAVEMVRYLVYLATTKSLLIKDKATIAEIKASKLNITKYVKLFGEEKLASVFFRFKPIFLGFKHYSSSNGRLINQLRRLANKFHKPMKVGFFEKLLTDKTSITRLPSKLSEITNFKKILLLQTINIRLKELDTNVYLIRNQKVYIEQKSKDYDTKYLKVIYHIIYDDLVNSLKSKACSISLPDGVTLTLPTSEKSFVGNYPLGTSFDMSDGDAIVGIHWTLDGGARDLDLSLVSIDGKKYGWNAAYKNHNNSIVYSGDMTYPDPEATELFYASKGFSPCIVKVNNFSGDGNAKFKFFLAKEKIKNLSRNYMVDPNNILVNVDAEMDSREKSLGVITENKFILAQFRTGKGRVSYNSVTDLYTEYALNTLDCYLSLETLLNDAGFKIVSKKADIDLTDLSKDSLISLLS